MPRSKNATKQAEAAQAQRLREPKTRNRPIKACFPCRYSKGRCDQARPKCARCEEHGLECQYLPTNLSPQQLAELNELKQNDRNIQKRRTVLAVGGPCSTNIQRPGQSLSSNDGSNTEGSLSGNEDEQFIQIDAGWTNDGVSEGDATDEDPFLELGFKVGKVLINDRHGAYQRPDADLEVSDQIFRRASAVLTPN